MVVELISYLVQHLVADPDHLEIRSREGERGVHIEIRCAKEDAGRIIGRGGRTINSIRTLARAASEGHERIEVQLVDA